RNGQKNSGGAGGGQPPAGGSGAKPLRPGESVDRHSSEDFRCGSACEDREMRPAPFLRGLPLWVGCANSASGRERCERTAARKKCFPLASLSKPRRRGGRTRRPRSLAS